MPKSVATWNELPRWVQRQRNWYRRYKDELGEEMPEPEWGLSSLSQSLMLLYEHAKRLEAKAEPREPFWYEFGGDKVAEEITAAWIEHLACPMCDMRDPDGFGSEWGTVECSDSECMNVWVPEWVTPWGPPTPRPANPVKYTLGRCPMCEKENRRLNPESPYAFVCKTPESGVGRMVYNLLWTPEESAEYMQRREESLRAWHEIRDASCVARYLTGFHEGWYRFLPVYFPFCLGCGVLFAARLPDQEYCSRECGHLPPKYSTRLRQMAAQVSPTLRRREVFERDDWVCHICGERVDEAPINRLYGASIDHVKPIARGGTHTTDNVKTAHLHCNIKKSDTVFDEEELYFLRQLILNNGRLSAE